MHTTRLRQILIIAGALACFTAEMALFYFTETVPIRLLFVVVVTIAVASLIVFLSRRILFASVVTLFLVYGICLVSYTKKTAMGMALHSYDFFFYINGPTLAFLWSSYRTYVVAAVMFIGLALAASALIWRIDRLRCSRMASGVLAVCAFVAVAWLEPDAWATTRVVYMLGPEYPDYLSMFYLSWPETYETLKNGGTLSAAAHTTLPNFAPAPACVPPAKPPHIVLIHQESLFPPSIFPQIDYDHNLDRFFYSDDDRLHKMRVETYGGGSWLTEFSIMTGLSTRSFGNMGPYLHVFMRGRLRETLPQWLASCGYRNVLFFPMVHSAFSLDRFYDSIGLHEIIDRDAQGAKSDRERDRFYFENAMTMMAQHFKSSDKPLFVYVQTMTAHAPYKQPYLPDEQVTGGGPGNSAIMNEYLRRVAIAAKDGEYFVDELKHRFPGEQFLIVRFGDHQPTVTSEIFGLPPVAVNHTHIAIEQAPDAFVTYYSVVGVNFRVPHLPEYDVLDVPFLQTVILDAAGLPLTQAQKEHQRLLAICAGIYFECKQHDDILTFHRRLIDSGIVTP